MATSAWCVWPTPQASGTNLTMHCCGRPDPSAGYRGIDCSLRICPKGDDPITREAAEATSTATLLKTWPDMSTSLASIAGVLPRAGSPEIQIFGYTMSVARSKLIYIAEPSILFSVLFLFIQKILSFKIKARNTVCQRVPTCHVDSLLSPTASHIAMWHSPLQGTGFRTFRSRVHGRVWQQVGHQDDGL